NHLDPPECWMQNDRAMLAAKKRCLIGCVSAALLLMCYGSCGGSGTVGGGGLMPKAPVPQFYGIHTNNLNEPWPSSFIGVRSWRTLGSSIKWADIHVGPASYDWTRL